MPRAQESPQELSRQSEAKRKQEPQSEANACRRRRKCNLKKTSLFNCTGHPTQIRGCVLVPRTQQKNFEAIGKIKCPLQGNSDQPN